MRPAKFPLWVKEWDRFVSRRFYETNSGVLVPYNLPCKVANGGNKVLNVGKIRYKVAKSPNADVSAIVDLNSNW